LSDVRVEVERDGNRGVAETLGHDLRVHAGLQCQGGVAVAEVVEADARQLGAADDPVERLREAVGMDGSAELVGEHQVAVVRPQVARREPFLELAGAVSLEGVEGHAVERDPATALAGLRRADVDAVAHGGEGLDDRQRSGVEVDVLPPQAEHLAAAHARGGEQHERHRQPLLCHRVEEPLDLL
jgi:hypothetical protein